MISILSGDNPFYSNEENMECIPDFILERFLLEDLSEEASTLSHKQVKALAMSKGHSSEKAHTMADNYISSQKAPKKTSSGYKHSSVSKHMSDKESAPVSHAIASFRDHVESHGKGSTDSIHRYIENKTKMKSKSSSTDSRGRNINSPRGRLSREKNFHHTHAYTNDGHKGEPSHTDHTKKQTRVSQHTADHVIHWTKKSGRVHIMGVSRHNDSKDKTKRHMSDHTDTMIGQNRMNENKH